MSLTDALNHAGALNERFSAMHGVVETRRDGPSLHTAASLQAAGPIRPAFSDRDFTLGAGSEITNLGLKRYRHCNRSRCNRWGLCQSFALPRNRGTIHHIRGNDSVNDEANRLFEEYQIQASAGSLLFRRWPFKKYPTRGPFLSNYFSQHSGEAYQVFACFALIRIPLMKFPLDSSQTVQFEDASSAIVGAHHLIETRVAAALRIAHPFNEVLSVAYLETHSMAFHSDNEEGLGPVVAGLSPGSPAVLTFRPTAKPKEGQHRAELFLVLHHEDILVMKGPGV
ncbi:hypothetical protein B0H13DRAFT_2305518 [Mycena leptocephala]|nr:hypothetical protein B0H13DRAFT_2305518 [Mycena leptocephala]